MRASLTGHSYDSGASRTCCDGPPLGGWPACPIGAGRARRDPSAMPALSAPLSTAALRTLLATERDPHLRQRELVRASLIARPGTPRATHRRAA